MIDIMYIVLSKKATAIAKSNNFKMLLPWQVFIIKNSLPNNLLYFLY